MGTVPRFVEAPFFSDGAPETYVDAIMQGKARSQINDALESISSAGTFDWWPF